VRIALRENKGNSMTMLPFFRLSEILIAIADNRTYHETALNQALNHEAARYHHRLAIRRYLAGNPNSTDHIELQELANIIKGDG
jgi:hypothetical protein